jgi:hypothetical protein
VLLAFSHAFFFYFRDNFSTHYPIKVVSAEFFSRLEIPYWNFAAGGGQPLAGNPNTLTFYPDNLLYLILPPQMAFNLHFLLHLLAGAWLVGLLARRYGCEDATARLAALIYVLSGPVIASLAFYNLVTAVALIPLALLALELFAESPGWRTALLLGGAFGLLALAGEPVTVAGAVLACSVLAAFRLRAAPRKVWLLFSRGMFAVVIAVVIALPLLVAYSEIAAEVERSTWRFSTETVLAASLSWPQLAESMLGPYRGLITDLGPGGYRANPGSGGWPPLFLSTFLGALLIPALYARGREFAPYRWILIVLLFFALGRHNPLLEWWIESVPAARIIRYPEKFALPLTVAAVLLMASWLSARQRSASEKFAAACGILLVLGTVGFGMISEAMLTNASRRRLLLGGALAVAVLLCAMLADRWRGARRAVIALTLVPLAYWAARAAPVDWSAPYREPSPLLEPALAPWTRIARPLEPERLDFSPRHERDRYRAKARMLDPIFGGAFGLHYALDRSPDAMYFSMTRIVNERARAAPLPLQLRYLRLAGCSTLITRHLLEHPSLAPVRSIVIDGRPVTRYSVDGAVPYVRSIGRPLAVRSVQQAVEQIESAQFHEQQSAIVPASRQGLPTSPARIHRLVRNGQEVRMEVSSAAGATLIVNETFFSSWEVRGVRNGSDTEQRLTIFPANLDRLGVIVPPGEWSLRVRFGRRRHLVVASWLFSGLALLGAAGAAARFSKNRTASPAR